jgi:hypothetical protein
MRAAVEDGAAIGAHEVCEARRFSARFAIAERTFERRSESLLPTLGLDDPRPHLPRRLVAYVLLMAACELGDPVSELVLVVADDRPLHPVRVRRAF